MTAEEAAVYAMARTSEITDQYPATRSLMYRRLGLRQRQLQMLAAKQNPDYYGVCAVSNLDDLTATDLNDIVEPIPTPEVIERIEVEDAGTSEWATGTEITVVTLLGRDDELPPRATLRDLVLQGVGGDLTGVVSVEIFYSRLAAPLGPNDADTAIELQDPFDDLLIIDLTRHLLRKATRLPGDVRTAAILALDEEEKPLLASYLDHVMQYAPQTSRFRRDVAR